MAIPCNRPHLRGAGAKFREILLFTSATGITVSVVDPAACQVKFLAGFKVMAVWFARPRIRIVSVELPNFPSDALDEPMNSGTVLSFAGQ
jgi:hypothetical protein